MPDPVSWYALPRTVLDTQSILEAVDAKMLEHNQDPSAHGQSSEVVFEHRNEGQIDHPDGSIDLRKFANDNIFFLTCFETFDAWTTGGTIAGTVMNRVIRTAAAINAIAYAHIETNGLIVQMNPAKNPFFQTTLLMEQSTGYTAYVIMGVEPSEGPNDSFGFKFSGSSLYAYWTSGGTQYNQEITGITVTEKHVYRAFIDSTEQKIYFYIDGVLKYTASSNFPTDSNDFIIQYHIKASVAAVRGIQIADLMIEIDR